MNPKFFYIFCIFTLQCGLFHQGVPKKGEFCNVLVKPNDCLFVDFQKRELMWNGILYPLVENPRLYFQFIKDNQRFELLVSTENRVDIKTIDSSEVSSFFMRKKEKFSTFTSEGKPNE